MAGDLLPGQTGLGTSVVLVQRQRDDDRTDFLEAPAQVQAQERGRGDVSVLVRRRCDARCFQVTPSRIAGLGSETGARPKRSHVVQRTLSTTS